MQMEQTRMTHRNAVPDDDDDDDEYTAWRYSLYTYFQFLHVHAAFQMINTVGTFWRSGNHAAW